METIKSDGSKENVTITSYGKKFYETVLSSIIPLKGYDDEKAKNLEIFIEKKDPSRYC